METAAKRKHDDDWSCATCGAHCFAAKSSCFKCGTSRTGEAPSTPGKHRRREGLYKPTNASMNFQDKAVVCKVCSKEFKFTAKEQQFFQSKGFFVERARCKDCAKKKKQEKPTATKGAAEGKGRPTSGGRLVCFAFQKGYCPRGDACNFAHGAIDGYLGQPAATKPKAVEVEEADRGAAGAASDGEEEEDAPAAPTTPEVSAKQRKKEAKEAKEARKAKKRAKLELGEAGAGETEKQQKEAQGGSIQSSSSEAGELAL